MKKKIHLINIKAITKEEFKTVLFEALGQVSMCWSETPKGVFESNEVVKIGNELLSEIEAKDKEIKELKKQIKQWEILWNNSHLYL